jgi:HEAT repeat protein
MRARITPSKLMRTAPEDVLAMARKGVDVVSPLKALLRRQDHSATLRKACALAALLEEAGTPLVPELREILFSRTASAEYAAWALGDMGEAGIEVLMEALQRDETALQKLGLKGLASARETTAELGHTIRHLTNSPDPDVRDGAWKAAHRLLGDSRGVIEQLAKQLADPSDPRRGDAAMELGRMSRYPELAVPPLVAALDNPDKGVRFFAASSLGYFGPLAAPALNRLCAMIADKTENPRTRGFAAGALAGIGRPALRALPALLAMLEDPIIIHEFNDAKYSGHPLDGVVSAIVALQPESKTALPALRRLLASELSLRWTLQRAIDTLERSPSVP